MEIFRIIIRQPIISTEFSPELQLNSVIPELSNGKLSPNKKITFIRIVGVRLLEQITEKINMFFFSLSHPYQKIDDTHLLPQYIVSNIHAFALYPLHSRIQRSIEFPRIQFPKSMIHSYWIQEGSCKFTKEVFFLGFF